MDLLLRYWSTKHQEVRVQYFTSIMFGHAKAEEVTKEMIAAMQKWDLPIKYLLSLGMDGPNVNKSICEKLNDKKKQQSLPQLVKCPPSCLIHVCHNSFHRGLSQYGNNAEELCLALYYFFKCSSCRRQDLFEIEDSFGLEELLVMHHAQSHWLSLVPALQHIVQIQDAIKKLLQDLPKSDKRITANDKYLFIKRSLESKEVSLEMEFLVSIKPLFDMTS